MPRANTSPGIPVLPHDAECCQACRAEATQLRIEIEVMKSDIENEQRYGKEDANDLTRLEGRVQAMEQARYRSEGRDEIRDKSARLWGAVALAIATGSGIPWVVKLIAHIGG